MVVKSLRNFCTGRLASSVAANWYGVGVTLGTQIVQVPLFLYAWPKDLYGDWLILFTIPSVLMFADIGIGPAAANRISIAIARDDISEAAAFLHSGMLGVLLAGTIILATLIGLSKGEWLKDWLGISIIDATDVARILLLFGITVFIWMQHSLLLGIFRGGDRFALGTMMTNTVRLAMLPAIAIPLLLKQSPVVVATFLAGSQVCGYLLIHAFCWRAFPNLRLGMSCVTWRHFRTLVTEGFVSSGMTFSNLVATHGTTLVVARTLSAADVVTFSAVRTLTRAGALFSASIKSALVPEFARLIGAGKWEDYRNLLRLGRLRVVAFSLLVGLVLFVGGPFLLSAWTNDTVSTGGLVLLLFVVAATVQSVALIPAGAVFASNQTGFLAIGAIASATLIVGASTVLTPLFGLIAIPFSMLIGEALMMVVSEEAARRLIRKNTAAGRSTVN